MNCSLETAMTSLEYLLLQTSVYIISSQQSFTLISPTIIQFIPEILWV